MKPKPKLKFKEYPIHLQTFGDHIRKKRIESGLSMSQLAKMLDVGKRRIAEWELYGGFPAISSYPKVIEFLGYDPLFDDSGTMQAQLKNYRRKYGLTYHELSRSIGINYTNFVQFVNHDIGSKKTIQMIQKFIEELSNR